MYLTGRRILLAAALLGAAVLAGCSTASISPAPVEDRDTRSVARVDPASLPGFENAGKPGYYTVRPGDTIMRIATEVNHPWRDIARWNNLDNPNVIEVGQVLRVTPPTGAAPGATTPITATPLPAPAPAASNSAKPPAAQAPVPVATQTTPGAASAAPAPAPVAAPPATPPSAGADDVDFIWPASGPMIAGFDEAKNKGLGIAGKAGDPVLAASGGKVVYSGTGLRGYGKLVIVKHNNTYLTAYAHNQSVLVKEGQSVSKGQKIAEMGNTDADQVKLHFEIRRQGKPVDPLKHLPQR